MDPMALKRPQLYAMGNSPHNQTQPSNPYPGQLSYGPPGPQRYPIGMQARTQSSMGAIQYPQQQVCDLILCTILFQSLFLSLDNIQVTRGVTVLSILRG